jgi:hypothetical protein
LTAVLALALASEDPVVRLDAARSIALLPENRLRDGFALGVDAADPEIRTEVMDLINWLQPHLRPELLGVALAAASADVQTRAIELLTDSPNPALFTVLIEGLRTSSPEVRPLVEQAITEIVDRHFTNFEEASAWWAQNHENYDNLMSLIRRQLAGKEDQTPVKVGAFREFQQIGELTSLSRRRHSDAWFKRGTGISAVHEAVRNSRSRPIPVGVRTQPMP